MPGCQIQQTFVTYGQTIHINKDIMTLLLPLDRQSNRGMLNLSTETSRIHVAHVPIAKSQIWYGEEMQYLSAQKEKCMFNYYHSCMQSMRIWLSLILACTALFDFLIHFIPVYRLQINDSITVIYLFIYIKDSIMTIWQGRLFSRRYHLCLCNSNIYMNTQSCSL